MCLGGDVLEPERAEKEAVSPSTAWGCVPWHRGWGKERADPEALRRGTSCPVMGAARLLSVSAPCRGEKLPQGQGRSQIPARAPSLSPTPGPCPFPSLLGPIPSPPCCGRCFLWHCPRVSPGMDLLSSPPPAPLDLCQPTLCLWYRLPLIKIRRSLAVE